MKSSNKNIYRCADFDSLFMSIPHILLLSLSNRIIYLHKLDNPIIVDGQKKWYKQKQVARKLNLIKTPLFGREMRWHSQWQSATNHLC